MCIRDSTSTIGSQSPDNHWEESFFNLENSALSSYPSSSDFFEDGINSEEASNLPIQMTQRQSIVLQSTTNSTNSNAIVFPLPNEVFNLPQTQLNEQTTLTHFTLDPLYFSM